MVETSRLRFLQAVHRCGAVGAAARQLGYTPSAVSQQIAALEREAGLPLLERVGRGVRPTAAGSLLTEHAAIIGRHVAEAELALADLRAGRTGRLAVRYFATAGLALLPPALAALRQEHPGVQVDLKLAEPHDSLPEVMRGHADVAIVVRHGPADPPPGVRLAHLLDDPYRLVLPRGHRLQRKRVIDLAELAEEPWVGNEWPAGPCVRIVLDACAAAGFTPGFVVESEDYANAQGFVAAGLGVSLIPRLGLTTPHPGVVIRRVARPEPVRVIQAAIRDSAAANPAVRCLLDTLRTAAAAA